MYSGYYIRLVAGLCGCQTETPLWYRGNDDKKNYCVRLGLGCCWVERRFAERYRPDLNRHGHGRSEQGNTRGGVTVS